MGADLLRSYLSVLMVNSSLAYSILYHPLQVLEALGACYARIGDVEKSIAVNEEVSGAEGKGQMSRL